ncbi:MAG TPA: SpoIID/LytB domain-containing protein, partial [Acidimicrobiales bacterium]|nr:SpoIID/LytB domain-containing protein [Acidimicrobiales bacterium]
MGRASAQPRTPSSSVVLQGHGAGNGVGLGQWGAYGYGTMDHDSWQWIVEHFYTGTSLEPVSTSVDGESIDVDLSELDTAGSTKLQANRSNAELIVNGVKEGRDYTVTHDGKETTVKTTAGDIEVSLPGIGWRRYFGYVEVQPSGHTWNVVPLEEYLQGVIPAESPASWGSASGGEAALQAQAVAARAYALAYVQADGDICDTD